VAVGVGKHQISSAPGFLKQAADAVVKRTAWRMAAAGFKVIEKMPGKPA
jgi:hypothetical protein